MKINKLITLVIVSFLTIPFAFGQQIEIDTIYTTDLNCYNDNTGKIEIYTINQIGPVEYSIDGGTNWSSEFNFTGLSAGTYYVIAKDLGDSNTETDVYDIILSEPSQIVVGTTYISDETCYGDSTGGYMAMPEGGIGGGYYASLDGANYDSFTSSINFFGLGAGSYTVYIKDDNDCEITDVFSIEHGDSLWIEVDSVKHPNCYGDANATVQLSGGGGTGTYSFNWSDGYNSSSSSSYNYDLTAGDYNVTFSDNNTGCQTEQEISIVNPEELVIDSLVVTDASCYEAADGVIDVYAHGGTGNLNIEVYPWNKAGLTFHSENSLQAGYYAVYIEDENHCYIDSGGILINEPEQVMFESLIQQVQCYGDSTGSILFELFVGNGQEENLQFSIDSGLTWQEDSLFNNLPAGEYYLGVKTPSGCEYIDEYSTYVDQPQYVETTIGVNQPFCYGETGSIYIGLSDYYPNYEVSIDGGGSWTTFGASPQQNDSWISISNLTIGSYNVIVKSDSECIIYNDTYEIKNPLSYNAQATNISCFNMNDGVIELNPIINDSLNVDTNYLSYTLLPGSITNTTGAFTDLSAGNYTVEIITNPECQTPVITSELQIINPDSLSISLETQNIECYGDATGSVTATVTGGTGAYTYSWNNAAGTSDHTYNNLTAGTYNLEVTDINGCTETQDFTINQSDSIQITATQITDNDCYGGAAGAISVSAEGGFTNNGEYIFDWSDNSNTQATTVSNLESGTYYVTCTDDYGCFMIDSFEVSSPEEIIIHSSITPITCNNANDGEISLEVTGGNPGYNFEWSNGLSNDSVQTGLEQGTYYVTVIDQNGCSVVTNMTFSNPAILNLSVLGTGATCYGYANGSAIAEATGGVAPYNFEWSNTLQDSEINNLQSGVYYVTMDDANGCIKTDSVEITQPDELYVNLGEDTSFCVSMELIADAGYNEYLWNNDEATQSIEIIESGTYIVTVFDENNCFNSDTIEATAKSLAVINGTIDFSATAMPVGALNIILFNTEGDNGYDTARVVSLNNNYDYSITDIHPGNYLVFANNIQEEDYPHHLDTYYGNTSLWSEAQIVELNCEIEAETNITITEIINQTQGTGSISGQIKYIGIEGAKAAGEPVEGAEILIQLDPDDYPINNTETDGDGNYDVSDLPVLEEGQSYSLLVDIAGLPLISTYSELEMREEGISYNNMNFYVDTLNPGEEGIYTDTSTFVMPIAGSELMVKTYPNPVQHKLNIELSESLNQDIFVSIIDLSGKIIIRKSFDKSRKITFDMDDSIKSGFYFIKVEAGQSVYMKKIIKE